MQNLQSLPLQQPYSKSIPSKRIQTRKSNQTYDNQNNLSYDAYNQPHDNRLVTRSNQNLNQSHEIQPNPYQPYSQQAYIPTASLPVANENQIGHEIRGMIDQQNNLIMSMIQGMTEDKERKMKEKNDALMKRIKRLEKKKRRLLAGGQSVKEYNGSQDFSDEEEDIQQELNKQNLQMLDNNYQNNQEKRGNVEFDPNVAIHFENQGEENKDNIFDLVDKLEPGTYVPIVPYEQQNDYDPGYNDYQIDSKVDQIKAQLRQKVGDYGTDNGMSLQDRVNAKLSQIGVKSAYFNIQSDRSDVKDTVSSKGAFLIEDNANERDSIMTSENLSRGSKSSLKFKYQDEPSAHGFINKFVSNVSQNKQLANNLYSNMKKNVPKANIGDLLRDFRIDEEDGMQKDPHLEAKEIHQEKIEIADKLYKLTRVQQNVNKFTKNLQDKNELNRMLNSNELIDSIGANQKTLAEEKAAQLIDQEYPTQESAKNWIISIIKPFLLSLLNEPKYDYASLLPEDSRPLEQANQIVNPSQDEIVSLSKDSLLKKFETRLKQLLNCFKTCKVETCPFEVIDFLRVLTTKPQQSYLNLMEINRLFQNSQTQELEQVLYFQLALLGRQEQQRRQC